MARFPTTEADIVVLAEEMISGFTDNPLVYPAPPVAVLDLTTAMKKAILVLSLTRNSRSCDIFSFRPRFLALRRKHRVK